MQEPRAGVIGHPADGDVVASDAKGHNVSTRRVNIVVGGLTGTPHNVKCVLYMVDKKIVRPGK